MRLVDVAALADVAPGQPRLVELDGRAVTLLNVSGEIMAFDDRCPHNGGPLHRGRVDGCMLACPWHGWTWDARTGRSASPPSDWRLRRHQAVVQDGRVLLESR
ncbi:MAG: Rieske 2Fe-2S domain-containing protein [Chloroflexota bacterium]